MEIQTLLTDQLPEVNVHRSAEAIPTRKSLWLHALDVPERIADVLKIETQSTLHQAGPLPTPVPEEVAVRALTGFVTVRAAEHFSLCILGISMGRKEAHRGPD
jgi:hypothetical protein